MRKISSPTPGLWIFVFALYALGLSATSRLSFFVHPKYVIFNTVMIALTVLAYGIYWRRVNRKSLKFNKADVAIAITVALSLGIYTPAGLSSSSAKTRGINESVPALTTKVRKTFSTNLSTLGIKDIVSLMKQSSDASYFIGKKVAIVGFVVPNDKDNRVVFVSRFIVSCCAIDARPVGIAVRIPENMTFSENDWVKVEGVFESDLHASTDLNVVVVPSLIEKVEQPEKPYEY